MSNSSLVTYKRLSPNHSGKRKYPITKITIHHMAGVLTVEQCGAVFANPARQASSNYGVDGKGHVGLYVDEANRSWASSNRENDNKAITIEVANSKVGGKWPVTDKALQKTIDLCVDICKRNGIKKVVYNGTPSGTLTLHQMFAPTACPGPYLKSKMEYIEKEVNKRLNPSKKRYSKKLKGKYKVTANVLNLRKGASTKYDIIEKLGKDTVVQATGYYYPNHYQVTYRGKKGWVAKKYLKKI